ncbi:MAG TPA: penicillin-binding protein 2 [Acidimicrobiales bacterium]|nr:penicillin-binding protein 2 [Acidimicrobiales bacterium]
MTVFFLAIAARLVSIQGVSADHYRALGLLQRVSTVSLPGQRGTIFDRSGHELAVSIPQKTILADPQQVNDPVGEAAALAPLIGLDPAATQARLTSSGQFAYLARWVGDAVAAQVTGLHLAGVYTMDEPKRFLPAGDVAAPLVGAVGTDNTGLSGLEQEYNAQLAGHPGKLIEEHDPSGVQIPGGLRQYQPAVSGQDLVLTIDEALQAQAEQSLASQIVAAKARGGVAAIMDTQTGELLAVASLTTDPAQMAAPAKVAGQPTCVVAPAVPVGTTAKAGASPTCAPAATANAAAFTNVYEPGSVSKLVTISSALENGVVVPSDRFSVADSVHLSDAVFHDAESHPVENWTVTDILANSSNVGTITIAQRLGKDRLAGAVADYGFGRPTGVGLPGESAGLIPTVAKWSATSIGTIAIGQGIGVTAIQMLAAYNTIANGGVYVAPKLVAATVDAGGQTHATAPAPEHRVVSAAVAQQMTTMLGEVVRVGTGQEAKVDGYTVAGKTGTALIPLANARGYMNGVYTASFAGFVPAEHPHLTGIVVLDQTPYFGGVASAPAFGAVAGYGLREFKIPPQAPVPPAAGVPLATAATAQAAGERLSNGVGVATTTGTNPPAAVTTTTAPKRSAGVTTTTAPKRSAGVTTTTAPKRTAGVTTTTAPTRTAAVTPTTSPARR